MNEFRHYTDEWIQRIKREVSPDDVEPLILQAHQYVMEQLHRELFGHENIRGQVLSYVLKNLHVRPAIKGLAHTLGYSQKYCSNFITAKLGESFSVYLKRIRIEMAQHYLADSHTPNLPDR